MGKLIVHQDKIGNIEETIKICPFGAMENKDNKIEINAGCKLCKLCVKKGPKGAFEFLEEKVEEIDKSLWNNIVVFVDHEGHRIHPVTFELIGKARELANKVNQKVYCVFIGYNIKKEAEELLHYGVDEVFVYDHIELEKFRIEPYTEAFADFIGKHKPTAILVGATNVGRSLAPRVAARFRTGLTADCTILDIKENTDLIQVRPAFGGNIMAQIICPNSRPQMSTVRYKIFEAPERLKGSAGKLTICPLDKLTFKSNIKVIDVVKKEVEDAIEDAEIIIAVGKALKSQKDLEMINELAALLGGKVAVTRPLVEAGWADAKYQIGLSGRTVRPKLIITVGISGAIHFVAGMDKADYIFAINKNEKAPIFEVANYGVVGDIYEVVPKLIAQLKK